MIDFLRFYYVVGKGCIKMIIEDMPNVVDPKTHFKFTIRYADIHPGNNSKSSCSKGLSEYSNTYSIYWTAKPNADNINQDFYFYYWVVWGNMNGNPVILTEDFLKKFYKSYEISDELEYKWWRALGLSDWARSSECNNKFSHIRNSSAMQAVEGCLRDKGLNTEQAFHYLIWPKSLKDIDVIESAFAKIK